MTRRFSDHRGHLLLAGALLFAGCASGTVPDPDPDPDPPGASLSEVAEAASRAPADEAGDPEGAGSDEKPERTREDGEPLESGGPGGGGMGLLIEALIAAAAEGSSPQEDSGFDDASAVTFGAVTVPTWYGGDELDRGLALGVFMGAYLGERRHTRLDLSALYTRLTFSEQVRAAFRDPFELSLSFAGRYYVTPGHTLVGTYVTGGMDLGIMSWIFQNPVEVDSGDGVRVIDTEEILTYAFHAGVGLSLVQARFVQLGAQAITGVRLYDVETLNERFENDFFDPTWFVRIGFEVTFLDPK